MRHHKALRPAVTHNRHGLRIVTSQISLEGWALQEMLAHSRLTIADLERREHPIVIEMVAHLGNYGWDDACISSALNELKALSA